MKIKRIFNESFAQIFISRILIFLHDKYFAKFLFIRKSARRVYFCCPIPGGDLRFGSIFCLPFYSKFRLFMNFFVTRRVYFSLRRHRFLTIFEQKFRCDRKKSDRDFDEILENCQNFWNLRSNLFEPFNLETFLDTRFL